MITTAKIKTVLDTDSIIREHRQHCVFWFNQDKTSFVAYAPRWGGWTIHLESDSSGYADTLEKAEKALYLKLLESFDLLLERRKRYNYIESSIEQDNSLKQTCQDLEMIWVDIMA